MEPAHVKGLIGSAGKSIAEAATRDRLYERLQAVNSQEAFREFLENAWLGMAEPSRTEFIKTITEGDSWRDWHSQLASAADKSWHEFRSPSS